MPEVAAFFDESFMQVDPQNEIEEKYWFGNMCVCGKVAVYFDVFQEY